MSEAIRTTDIEALKKELMQALERQDPRALRLIRRLQETARRSGDQNLLSYAYYRYAYYYYFTRRNEKLFRKYLQIAIGHLLRSGDKEFLGGAYNLVAYDAQDQECYDIAYAYLMIAVQTCEQVPGIALPGLIEANAGRILMELGDCKTARQRFRSAARRLRAFPKMHVFNYNMILTYADEALASFLLKDRGGVEKALAKIQSHVARASEGEMRLSFSYYVLPQIYAALLSEDRRAVNNALKELLSNWSKTSSAEISGLIFEIEAMTTDMIGRDYRREAEKLLAGTESLLTDENLSVAERFCALKILLCEKTGNRKKLDLYLRKQHAIRKKENAERMRTRRYSMEFSDMIENIAEERARAREENIELQLRANTDSLTALPNRNAINGQLSEMFEEAQRKGLNFGAGIMDVDNFKLYNDTYGHQTGDICLQKIGQVLLSYAEDPRICCARYGGDEFVIGYRGLSHREIRRLADEMQERVAEATAGLRKGIREGVQISQGIHCAVPDETQRIWDFLSLADRKLYRIKGKKLKKAETSPAKMREDR